MALVNMDFQSGGGQELNPVAVIDDQGTGTQGSSVTLTCEVGKTYVFNAVVQQISKILQLSNADIVCRTATWVMTNNYYYWSEMIVFTATDTTVTVTSSNSSYPGIWGKSLIKLD